jgi:hypothetical protein
MPLPAMPPLASGDSQSMSMLLLVVGERMVAH